MSFVSLEFLVFLAAVAALYFLVPRRGRWGVLLAASLYFYLTFGLRYLLFPLISVATAYAAALALEKENAAIKAGVKETQDKEEKQRIRAAGTKRKKLICAAALLCNFGIWGVLKYSAFFVQNLDALLLRLPGGYSFAVPQFVLPLGISFYTFQAMGYVIDIYRSKYPAEKNILHVALFLTYFPHIMQGPFSRFNLLGKTLFAGHSFSYDRLCEGSRRILWGFFKKLLIADKIGTAVAAVFAEDGSGGLFVLLAAVFYGIQIYADFSGYMDIVCGFSHVLGIEVAENFNQPYFSHSVEEFWRRWHITLGQWFRDYLFYPVSMGKTAQKLGKSCRQRFGARMGKLIPSYLALILVWTATGLWHGASWTYLIWGYLNLVVIVAGMQLEPLYQKEKAALHIAPDSKAWNLFQILRTFLLVCLFRFFSRADTLGEVFHLYGSMFSRWSASIQGLTGYTSLFPNMLPQDINIFLAALVALIAVDLLRENGKWEQVKAKTPAVVRGLVYIAMIYGIIFFAGGDNDLTKGFIYAQF